MTSQPRPHRRAETFPFASGEAWRPLRLVLDDETLAAYEQAELLAFGHYDEIEFTRTAPDALPRLEIQEPTENFVPIQSVGDGGGVFWVWHAARLRVRARELAATSDADEETAYRALVFAGATEEMDADGLDDLVAELGERALHRPGYEPLLHLGIALRNLERERRLPLVAYEDEHVRSLEPFVDEIERLHGLASGLGRVKGRAAPGEDDADLWKPARAHARRDAPKPVRLREDGFPRLRPSAHGRSAAEAGPRHSSSKERLIPAAPDRLAAPSRR